MHPEKEEFVKTSSEYGITQRPDDAVQLHQHEIKRLLSFARRTLCRPEREQGRYCEPSESGGIRIQSLAEQVLVKKNANK